MSDDPRLRCEALKEAYDILIQLRKLLAGLSEAGNIQLINDALYVADNLKRPDRHTCRSVMAKLLPVLNAVFSAEELGLLLDISIIPVVKSQLYTAEQACLGDQLLLLHMSDVSAEVLS